MGVRPSDVYFIHDELAAWCFDRAVTYFGQSVEADMHEAAERAKTGGQMAAQRRLAIWLHDDPNTIPKGIFRDPAAGR